MLGLVKLAVPLSGLAKILQGKKVSENEKAYLFVVDYVLWHERIGLSGELQNYYKEHSK